MAIRRTLFVLAILCIISLAERLNQADAKPAGRFQEAIECTSLPALFSPSHRALSLPPNMTHRISNGDCRATVDAVSRGATVKDLHGLRVGHVAVNVLSHETRRQGDEKEKEETCQSAGTCGALVEEEDAEEGEGHLVIEADGIAHGGAGGGGGGHWRPSQTKVKLPEADTPKETSQAAHSHKHEHEHKHDHAHEHHHEHEHAHEESHKHSHDNSHEHHGHHHSAGTHGHERLSTWTIVRWTVSATALISVAPLLLLLVIPLNNTALKPLLAFGVGGLLGDVFLHLLPHTYAPHDHVHVAHDAHDAHDHTAGLVIGLQVLAGILTFFILEKMTTLARGQHGHGHSHASSVTTQKTAKTPSKQTPRLKRKNSSPKVGDKAKNKTDAEDAVTFRLRTGALLNMVADAAHNFTDGLALAASFRSGWAVGVGTTVAVLLHEVPHEIGDLALLVRAGYSRKSVLLVQLLTALGALVGALIGLAVGAAEWEATAAALVPLTAGGFLYVAMVDVIPLLFEETTWKQTVQEVVALVSGVAIMAVVAWLE